jgi:hypothetical protein
MPLRARSIMSEREEFVVLAATAGSNMTRLCERFGISRETGHVWLRRFNAGGAMSLCDRSRRPRSSPGKTDDGMESLIVEIRRRHPAWGGRKIKGAAGAPWSRGRSRGQHGDGGAASARAHYRRGVGRSDAVDPVRAPAPQRPVAHGFQGADRDAVGRVPCTDGDRRSLAVRVVCAGVPRPARRDGQARTDADVRAVRAPVADPRRQWGTVGRGTTAGHGLGWRCGCSSWGW